jgi:myo-inositol 2-dehydrogenase/D-chiro-inositol 1-dehydrogenase
LSLVGRDVRVLVEKPLALTVAEAASFVTALGDRRDAVQIAFQRHYDGAARAATRWFDEGRIGAIQQSHHVLQDKNPTPPAYQSAGITADMAIHLIFEAMSFHRFELPRTVQALRFMAPHYDDRANEGANVVHAFLQWADGSIAHLWGSRINNTGYDNGFKLIGTEGRIDVGEFVGDFGMIHARLWTGTRNDGPRGVLAESLAFEMTPSSPGHPDFHARFAAAYAGEVDAFVDALRQRRPLEPGIDVGWKTMLIAELAERSSREGGRAYGVVTRDGSPVESASDAAALAA